MIDYIENHLRRRVAAEQLLKQSLCPHPRYRLETNDIDEPQAYWCGECGKDLTYELKFGGGR